MTARRLAFAAVVAVFVLMTLGNVVSVTGSGVACPDWPLCHGSLIPPPRPDVLIEYGHRLAALLVAQIVLGGITVLLKLPPLISTVHLVNALLILGGLIVLARGLGRPASPSAGTGSDRARRLTRAGLAVLLVQLALGGYVRHSGAGLACPDFPLCGGDILPAQWLAGVHWVHRWLGVLLLGLFVHLAVAGRTTATRLAATLAVLQVSLGVATVLLQLTPVVRAAHAAGAYALWAALVWASVEAGCWRRSIAPAPRSSAIGEAARAA